MSSVQDVISRVSRWGSENRLPHLVLGVAPRTTHKEDIITWVVFLDTCNVEPLGRYMVATFREEDGSVDQTKAYWSDDLRKAWAEFCQRAYPFQEWPR
jgi:hypothetical protein